MPDMPPPPLPLICAALYMRIFSRRVAAARLMFDDSPLLIAERVVAADASATLPMPPCRATLLLTPCLPLFAMMLMPR